LKKIRQSPFTSAQKLPLGRKWTARAVQWRNNQTGALETHNIRHVFMMTELPNTRWLEGCVVQDKQGFIKTGPNLTPEDLASARWPLGRTPYIFETSLPGVFAVGDVRSGNMSAWRRQSAKDRPR